MEALQSATHEQFQYILGFNYYPYNDLFAIHSVYAIAQQQNITIHYFGHEGVIYSINLINITNNSFCECGTLPNELDVDGRCPICGKKLNPKI